MKKTKILFRIFSILLTCTSQGAEYICEGDHHTSSKYETAVLEFSDQQGTSAKPIIFSYDGQSHAMNYPVKTIFFCKNRITGEFECGGNNDAPISDISYRAGDRDDFFFELYWSVKPNGSDAQNYAAIFPYAFLEKLDVVMLKCKVKTP